jgi:DNA-binding response OmpR family regulator
MEMAAAAREASVPDPRVLLIEQEGPFAETLIAAFEAEGIRADWARTGADGLALKAKLCPDIVLVGFRLPDMSEIDVVSQLVPTRDCGVVVLSDMTNEAARETCLDYGADDYLPSHAIVWDAVARVRAVQRRLTRQVRTAAPEDPGAALVIGPVRIDLRHRTVHAH